MNAIIANILKQKLSNLDWIERFGGMVTQATKPVFVTVDGQQVITGYKTYPVSCWVNEAEVRPSDKRGEDILKGAEKKRGNIVRPSAAEIELTRKANRERIKKYLKL